MSNNLKKQITIVLFSGIILFSWVISVYPGYDLSFKVPAPPEGKLEDVKALNWSGRDILTLLYKSRLNEYDVINFYKRFFNNRDFLIILEKKEQFSSKRLLRFRKEDLVVSLAVTPQGEETQVVIAKYLQPEDTLSPEKTKFSLKDFMGNLPKTDNPGEDLKIVPRPPQSIRWVGRKWGRQFMLTYATELSVPQVVRFYKDRMPNHTWRLKDEIATQKAINAYERVSGKKIDLPSPFGEEGEDLDSIVNDSVVLDFRGDYGQAKITAFPNFVDRKSGSIVSIIYKKEGR
jgi:hypothetical protein